MKLNIFQSIFSIFKTHSLTDLEKKYSIKLPPSYKEWFQNMSYDSDYFCGSDVSFPKLNELNEWAQILLDENKCEFKLPDNHFVFWMHQGYQFMYFICDGSDSCEIWYYDECSGGVPRIKWDSFESFVSDTNKAQ